MDGEWTEYDEWGWMRDEKQFNGKKEKGWWWKKWEENKMAASVVIYWKEIIFKASLWKNKNPVLMVHLIHFVKKAKSDLNK